jgi:hypothetical protein
MPRAHYSDGIEPADELARNLSGKVLRRLLAPDVTPAR